MLERGSPGWWRGADAVTDNPPPQPFFERWPTWEELSPLLEVVVTVGTAVVGAAWIYNKYVNQRTQDRADRKQAERDKRELEAQRLEQQALEEANRRSERAAELILEFGKEGDPSREQLIASALSMYVPDVTPVLITALGQVKPRTAEAIANTLVSVGASSMESLIRANRMGSVLRRSRGEPDCQAASVQDAGNVDLQSDGVLAAQEDQMLDMARAAIGHVLLLHLDDDERRELDLSEVDLRGLRFDNAHLAGLNARKADVRQCSFGDAQLADACFRGAVAAGATFTNARARAADFTGFTGEVGMIRLNAPRATFDHAELQGSHLDAARLQHASFVGTKLQGARLSGADLTEATLQGCGLGRANGERATFRGASITGCQFASAELSEARMDGVSLSDCQFGGSALRSVAGMDLTAVDCHFGGVDLGASKLAGATFTRCSFGGASFDRAVLDGTSFIDCDLTAFDFKNADVTTAEFVGETEFRPDDVVFANETWKLATYGPGAEELQRAVHSVESDGMVEIFEASKSRIHP